MELEYMQKKEKVFPVIRNRENFLLKEIPNLHPSSIKYLKYWKEQKKRCIEGYWAIDDKDANAENAWRFMPSNLYFYVNFGTILHKPEGASRTDAKKPVRPHLRDIEWAFFYNFYEARGFSGFNLDDEYSACRDIEKYEKGKLDRELIHESCFNSNGDLKEFIDPRDYVRKLWNKPMGRPLYFNEAKNLMLLGSRGFGKSFSVGVGIVLHEMLFDSAKEYTQENIDNPAVAEVFVGSAISSKSAELLSKTYDAYIKLPGVWAKGTEDELPSAFYKEMSGSLRPNNMKAPWRHEYEKKIAGKWQKLGSRSHVYHGIWTTENPEAAAGTRPGIIICEEVGLAAGILKIHGCFAKETQIRLFDGSKKTIENIVVNDELMGPDGLKRTVSELYSGVDDMYKISQKNGSDYIVNSEHRLYLEQYRGTKTDGFKTITAKEWNDCDIAPSKRYHTYGIKSGALEFESRNELLLDPYFMGLWIGDGVVKSCGICYDPKTDSETRDWLINYYKSLGLTHSTRDVKGADLCCGIAKKTIKGANHIRNSLRYYETYDKKFLHEDFLKASRSDRLKLLAGLIDSDGTFHRSKDGFENAHSYVFYQSGRKDLVDKVEFLCRSLGFRINTCIHIDNRRPNNQDRQQVAIYGNLNEIPCNLTRKKAPKVNSNYNRSTVRSGINIEHIGIDNYYGFKLEEDDKFLLADNTIVYNSNNAAQVTDGTDKFGSSIYIGTSGSMEKIIESEIIFRNPSGFEMMEFDDEWEGSGKICWFVPAIYADGKYKDENGNTIEDKALTNYEDRRKEKKKASSRTAIDLELMNFPLVPSEMFLNVGNNSFPVADLKQRYSELLSSSKILDATWKGRFIVGSDGKIKWKNTSDNPIYEYPVKDNEDIHGAVHMFEPPKKNSENVVTYGRYIAGFDPVDDDDDDRERSLQSFFIMDVFTDRIVLEYSARSRYASEFYEQVRRGLMYYNATVNYENQKKGFYAYMKNKVSLHLLAETPEILRDMDMQKTSRTGNKGFGTSANLALNNWGIELQLEWLEAQAHGQVDGMMNLNLIKSPAYLRELILFDGKRNADRVSAMGMLLIYRQEKLRMIQSNRNNTEIKQETLGSKMLSDIKRSRMRYNSLQKSSPFR